MKKRILPLSVRTSVIALVVTTLAVGAPLAAMGAERVVLAEMFTRYNCSHCPEAGEAMEMMLEDYPAGFTTIQYHVGNDPIATPWANERGSGFYHIPGQPVVWIDGVSPCIGAPTVSVAFQCYEGNYISRQAVPAPIRLELGASRREASEYAITIKACLEDGAPPTPVRIYGVQVLDDWPELMAEHHPRNTFRRAMCTHDVVLQPGACHAVVGELDFAVDDPADPLDPNDLALADQIRIIAWVQAPLDDRPAEIFQAIEVPWPLPIMDCNNNGLPDDVELEEGTRPDDNGNGIPDECDQPEPCAGDSNCSGYVDWRDIDFFVAAQNDNESAWRAMFAPHVPVCPFENNDCDGDGYVNWRDIDAFVAAQNDLCDE